MACHPKQLDGLAWDEGVFGAEPRWTIEPDLDKVKSALERLWPSETINVVFHARGAFNTLYSVDFSGRDLPPLILRVSLPVDPRHKTLSEIATIEWVSNKTTLSIPRVVMYDCSRENDIGFEWILMTKLGGFTLHDTWRQLDLFTKSSIVRHLAKYCASLFQSQVSGIGNIYPQSLNEHGKPKIGRIVSMPFFWNRRIHYGVDRGPFFSSQSWFAARLLLCELDCLHILDKNDVEDDIDDANRTLDIVRKLQFLLPQVFPRKGGLEIEEKTIIHHSDFLAAIFW